MNGLPPSAVASAPLLVTAELPPDIFAWAEGLRRRHYPPDRNRVRAHVTLFHALPPSVESEVRRLLARETVRPPPAAELTGIMKLGRGTAIDIASPALHAIHAELARALHGVLTVQDAAQRRLHVTIQNKVAPAEAKALQATLAAELRPRGFHFAGLALHRWRGGVWEDGGRWPFRGGLPKCG
ncbi:MAG: 2'-5' RNA ligase family protein [Novosphingobium sp.]